MQTTGSKFLENTIDRMSCHERTSPYRNVFLQEQHRENLSNNGWIASKKTNNLHEANVDIRVPFPKLVSRIFILETHNPNLTATHVSNSVSHTEFGRLTWANFNTVKS